MSFTTALVGVNGIQVSAQREYTSQTVLDIYAANMKIIRDFMGDVNGPGSDAGITPGHTGPDLINAIEALRDLAIQGRVSDLGSGFQKTYYLTNQMAGTLDFLFKSLETAGVTVSRTDINVPTSALWFQRWYDLGAGTPLLQNIFMAALIAEGSNSSLQSMVELQYVKNANDLLGEKMGDLQQALQLTKESLSLLTNIQNLHNLIQVSNRPPFSTFFKIFQSNASYQAQYTAAASAYFAMPLVPTLLHDNWTIPTYLGFLNYISNIAVGNVHNFTTNTLVLTKETNDLMPASFKTRYNLQPPNGIESGDPPVYTYTSYAEIMDYDASYLGLGGVDPTSIGGIEEGVLAHFNIKYTSAFGPGATFTGVTTQPSFKFDRFGTIDINEIMSATLGLSRTTGAAGLETDIQNLVTYRNALSAQIAILHTLNPQGAADPNSLETRLKVVLTNISAVFVTSNGQRVTTSTSVASAYTGFKKWMLDKYGSGDNNAGQIQQDITNAIAAGQSLNDTQKENVRQFLFIFEEFYKSASAILQTLTQIIERIAQGLARG